MFFFFFLLLFFSFKELFLKPEEVEKLHDFEEECVEDYWREKQRDERKQSELQLDNISSRMAAIQYRMGEVHLHQRQLRGDFHALEEEVLAGQAEVISWLDDCKRSAPPSATAVAANRQAAAFESEAVNDPVLLGSLMWLLKNALDAKKEESSSDFDADTDNAASTTPRTRGAVATPLRSHCRRPCCQQHRPAFSTSLTSHTEEENDNAEDTPTAVAASRSAKLTRQMQRLRHEVSCQTPCFHQSNSPSFVCFFSTNQKSRRQRRQALGLDRFDNGGDSDTEMNRPRRVKKSWPEEGLESPPPPHPAAASFTGENGRDWLRLLAQRVLQLRAQEGAVRSQREHQFRRMHAPSLSPTPSISAHTVPPQLMPRRLETCVQRLFKTRQKRKENFFLKSGFFVFSPAPLPVVM